MKVIVTNKEESVIYNGEIFKDGDVFDAEDIIAKSLIERGYVKEVTEAAPAGGEDVQEGIGVPDDLNELSYPELKKLAAKLGLDATGKKDELIARINSAGEEVEAVEEASDELPNTSMPE